MVIKNFIEYTKQIQELFNNSENPEKLRQALEEKDIEKAANYSDKTPEEIENLFAKTLEEVEEPLEDEETPQFKGTLLWKVDTKQEETN